MAQKSKTDFIDIICQHTELSKADASDVFETILEMMKSTLEQGENIKISGFGNFMVSNKDARLGRNPITGEALEIRARKILKFKPSSLLKAAINGKDID